MSFTRKGGALLVGVVLAMAGSAAPASAISDRDYCEDVLGGTYVKDGGTSDCTVRDQAGSSHVFKEEETSQKGSFRSSHPTEEEKCVDNPAQDC